MADELGRDGSNTSENRTFGIRVNAISDASQGPKSTRLIAVDERVRSLTELQSRGEDHLDPIMCLSESPGS
jgi:hypothetical protein